MRYKLTRNDTTFCFKKDSKKIVINADGVVLGRLTSFLVNQLRGKMKVSFTPNADCSDVINVINCDKILVSGSKINSKRYYKHTGNPGGFGFRTFPEVINSKNPQDVIKLSIKRMMSRGPLFYKLLGAVKFFKSNENFEQPKDAVVLDFKNKNRKNSINK